MRLAAGLRPDPRGELTALPRPPSWIGRCPQGGEKGWKGEGKGGEEQNSSYEVIIHPITEGA